MDNILESIQTTEKNRNLKLKSHTTFCHAKKIIDESKKINHVGIEDLLKWTY